MARGVNAIVRIKKQDGLNQAASFTATDKLEVVAFNSESFRANVNQVASQSLRRQGMRQKAMTRLGTLDVGGGITIEPTNNSLANLLPLIFPTDGISNVGSETAPAYAKQYVITASSRPYATVVVDDGELVRAYANMMVSQWTLGASVDQPTNMSVDFVGTNFQTNSGNAATAWNNGVTGNIPQVGLGYVSPLSEYGLYFDQANVEIGTTAGDTVVIPATDFNLSVNHNAATDRFKLGSRYRRDVPTGVADVTGSFTLDANYNPNGGGITTTDWAYQAIQNSTYLALKLRFIDPSNEMKSGEASSLELTLPYIFIDTPDWNIGGPDIVTGAINFTAFADGANGLTLVHKYKLDV